MKKIYHIIFLDHCHNTQVNHTEPLECEVFGRVEKQTKKYVLVSCWRSTDRKWKCNDESFTILKSTIISMREISYV